jgi:hypothetical protein
MSITSTRGVIESTMPTAPVNIWGRLLPIKLIWNDVRLWVANLALSMLSIDGAGSKIRIASTTTGSVALISGRTFGTGR